MTTKVKPSAPVEPERMYTFDEIAALAGVSARAVKRWCDEGRIGFVRLPKGRRILGRHYAAFIAEREEA